MPQKQRNKIAVIFRLGLLALLLSVQFFGTKVLAEVGATDETTCKVGISSMEAKPSVGSQVYKDSTLIFNAQVQRNGCAAGIDIRFEFFAVLPNNYGGKILLGQAIDQPPHDDTIQFSWNYNLSSFNNWNDLAKNQNGSYAFGYYMNVASSANQNYGDTKSWNKSLTISSNTPGALNSVKLVLSPSATTFTLGQGQLNITMHIEGVASNISSAVDNSLGRLTTYVNGQSVGQLDRTINVLRTPPYGTTQTVAITSQLGFRAGSNNQVLVQLTDSSGNDLADSSVDNVVVNNAGSTNLTPNGSNCADNTNKCQSNVCTNVAGSMVCTACTPSSCNSGSTCDPNTKVCVASGNADTTTQPTFKADKAGATYAPGDPVTILFTGFPPGWKGGVLSINQVETTVNAGATSYTYFKDQANYPFNSVGTYQVNFDALDSSGNPITNMAQDSITITISNQASAAGTTAPGVNPCATASGTALPNGTNANGCLYNPLPTSALTDMLLFIIKGFMGVLGIWSVMFVIVGGFRLVLSSGSDEQVTAAKKTITWAIIGLIIALLSFSIIAIVENILNVSVHNITSFIDTVVRFIA